MGKSRALEHTSQLIERLIKESGSMIFKRGKDSRRCQMDPRMKESLNMESETVGVHTTIIKQHILVTLLMIKNMVRENLYGQMVKDIREAGRTI